MYQSSHMPVFDVIRSMGARHRNLESWVPVLDRPFELSEEWC